MDLAFEFSNTPVAPQRPRSDYRLGTDTAPAVVSIITPFHNTGPVFWETAQSVFQQTLQQWEWLIIDDGSGEPESMQILAAVASKDARIRVLSQGHNQGPGHARNIGLQAANADLVFYLDSDDLIEPTALEKMAWCLESYPEFSFCKGYSTFFGAEETLSTHGFEARERFLQWNAVTISAAVRRNVALACGGFDESLTSGLEDWDFWLRCAAQGHWGRTIPEFLDWYRRRESHSDRWSAWTEGGEQAMRQELRRRYPDLYANGLPPINPRSQEPFADVRDDLPFPNLLAKEGRRMLLIFPWLAMGGADRFNLDLLDRLQAHGYEITIATTLPTNYAWFREFAKRTTDIFILPKFLRPTDYPRFLYYLIQSRQHDAVLVSNSELGYRLLPFLRARCPDTAFVDYCHMEEDDWNSGGHPRQAVAYQEALDLNIVSSQHLKDWMVQRGADASHVAVCYTNVDTERLHPDPDLRTQVRQELGIPPGVPLILYAGRLCEQKQPRVFARVMRELAARKPNFVCLVAGDGEERKWLASYLRRHRLRGQVRMLGRVSNERARQFLAASDIFFLPSQMEGISLTIYEAMALGAVVVGADVGGQSELLTPECGILIQRAEASAEIKAYADALDQLLQSPELRASLAQAARDRVDTHFRLEQMGQRMVELLQLAETKHRTRPRPKIGPGLGTEHAVLALEYQRLFQAAGGLWKYQCLESELRKVSGRTSPWLARWKALTWRLRSHLQPLRKAKDAVWIVGHRAKIRLLKREESG